MQRMQLTMCSHWIKSQSMGKQNRKKCNKHSNGCTSICCCFQLQTSFYSIHNIISRFRLNEKWDDCKCKKRRKKPRLKKGKCWMEFVCLFFPFQMTNESDRILDFTFINFKSFGALHNSFRMKGNIHHIVQYYSDNWNDSVGLRSLCFGFIFGSGRWHAHHNGTYINTNLCGKTRNKINNSKRWI